MCDRASASRGFTQLQGNASSIPFTACEVSLSTKAISDLRVISGWITKGLTLRHQATLRLPGPPSRQTFQFRILVLASSGPQVIAMRLDREVSQIDLDDLPALCP